LKFFLAYGIGASEVISMDAAEIRLKAGFRLTAGSEAARSGVFLELRDAYEDPDSSSRRRSVA